MKETILNLGCIYGAFAIVYTPNIPPFFTIHI